MSSEQKLKTLLGWNWKSGHNYIYANTKYPKEYIETIFPPSLWYRVHMDDNKVIIYRGNYERFIETLELDENFGNFPYSYDVINVIISELHSAFDEVLLEPSGIIINSDDFSIDFPPELVELIETKDDDHLIPMIYLPLLYDYYTQFFPIYFPTSLFHKEKLAKFFNQITSWEWIHSDGDTISTKIEDNLEVIDSLSKDLGIEIPIFESKDNIEIRNVSKIYTQLWELKHLENPLYLQELKFNQESELQLQNKIGIKDVIKIIRDYNNIFF